MRGFRDGIANHGKYLATVKIQKYMRGYAVSKKYEQIIIDVKLNQNIEFFEQMKRKMYTDAQVFIAYFWRNKAHRRKGRRKNNSKTKGKMRSGSYYSKKAEPAKSKEIKKSSTKVDEPASKEITKDSAS